MDAPVDDVGSGLVVDLADPAADPPAAATVDRIGGKAARLAAMTAAGMRVPTGVCLTTQAYAAVAAEPSVAAAIAGLLAAASADRPERARAVRAALMAAPVPDAVSAAVTDAYRRMGSDVAVAVRSSATAEDLPTASFAGQQDSVLNVVGVAAVLAATRSCWASLWNDRAVAYREANGIDQAGVRLAVVIQHMVDVRAAGVMFTADPVGGRRDRTTVDASAGLGESVVSGAVDPDHFVLDSATGTVLERRIGEKQRLVRPVSGGGTVIEAAPGAGAGACVDDDELARLTAAGAAVQQHFGGPQDVEWALDRDGTLWLTQSRPVTSLFPLPTGNTVADDTRTRAWFCYSLVWQGVRGPLTPVGLSALRLVSSGMAELAGMRVPDPDRGAPAFAESGGRMFLDITTALTGASGRSVLPRLLRLVDATTSRLVEQLATDNRFPLRDTSTSGLTRRLVAMALRAGVPWRVLEAVVAPRAARRRVDRLGAAALRRYRTHPGATAAERLAAVRGLLLEGVPALFPRIVPIPAVGGAALKVAVRLLNDDVTEEEGLTVLRGMPHNVTTAMDLALWELACRAGGDPAAAGVLREHSPAELAARYRAGMLPDALGRGLAAFLHRYGHRAVAEIDLGAPRWSEDPEPLLASLATYVALPDGRPAPDRQFADGAAVADATVGRLVARARGRRGRALPVRFALRRTRQLLGLREATKFHCVALIARARELLAEVGAELAAAGRIVDAQDVYFLELPEVVAAVQGRGPGPDELSATVAARRARFEQERSRVHVPRVVLSDGSEPALPPAADGGLLGTPASPGSAIGTARVVLDPAGAALRPGDVLVAPSSDPGWTPLFLTAAAVVLETGGVNSHGAVVARELGIPAVVGVPGACTSIVDGQALRVDGASGTITMEPGRL